MIRPRRSPVRDLTTALAVLLTVSCGKRTTPRPADSASAVATVPSVDSTPGPIPAAFRGTWDASADRCTSPASEMRLVVGADSIHYYEGTGAVLRVAPLISDGGQMLRVETRHEAEGMIEPRTQTLALRGGHLWVKVGADSTERVRCTTVVQSHHP